MLIHKYRTDDRYPSRLQSVDRQMPFDVVVRDRDGRVVPGQEVHFRVAEPPDAAAYVPRNDRRTGDNGCG